MSSASRPNLGQRLRELRTRNAWRIADVSRLTGLASSTISKVENGRMSLTYDKLQQLAHGLSLVKDSTWPWPAAASADPEKAC
jgi:transcriptional regulator with XRE-family HTH domain